MVTNLQQCYLNSAVPMPHVFLFLVMLSLLYSKKLLPMSLFSKHIINPTNTQYETLSHPIPLLTFQDP